MNNKIQLKIGHPYKNSSLKPNKNLQKNKLNVNNLNTD